MKVLSVEVFGYKWHFDKQKANDGEESKCTHYKAKPGPIQFELEEKGRKVAAKDLTSLED
jgi:hypothetical protein